MIIEVAGENQMTTSTPKKSSAWTFASAFVLVVGVYAVASLASRSNADSQGSEQLRVLTNEVTIRDLQEDSNRRALRRELQTTPGTNETGRLLQINGTGRLLQINGTERRLQINDTGRYLQDGNDTRYLQEGNRTRRYLQDVNGTERFLQEGNETRRFLQDDNNTRALEEQEMAFTLLYPETVDLQLPSPCHRVDVGMPNSPEWRARCQMYLNEAYLQKDCANQPEIVPRIYHSVSHYSDQTYHQLATSAQNPSFIRNHLSDEEAAQFILENCGEEAYQAYRCFAPPAYRADMFRFCALHSHGGIYLDEDIFPFVPLEELYSPCSTATVGHDFPWMDKKGKQMKILASTPGAPIFQCALHNIIESVRARAYPETELELTGPQMLQKCYEQHSEDVSVTYHDTRNAEWPFTGMRRGQKILAYEIPMSSKHFWQEGGKDKEDYTDLFNNRKVYKETCELN